MARRRAHVLIAATSGCIAAFACGTVLEVDPNAVESKAEGGVEAAAGDAAPLGDAQMDRALPRTCAWDAPFDTAPSIVNVALGSVGNPRLSEDELVMAFDHLRSPDLVPQVRIASRIADRTYTSVDVDAGFGDETRVARPSLSKDGLIIFFDVQRPDASTKDIFVAVRDNRVSAFGSPAPVMEVNTGNDEGYPFITNDGLELWYVAGSSIGVLDRTTGDAGATPLPPDHSAPVLSADRLTIYLKAPPPGGDIVVAHRATTSVPFEAPAPIKGTLAPFFKGAVPGWLSPDQCRFYVTVGASLAVVAR